MKLLPAVLCIVALFLAGLFFVQGRGTIQGMKGHAGTASRRLNKTAAFAFPIVMLICLGTLFIFMGKIAVLIASALIAILLLSSKLK